MSRLLDVAQMSDQGAPALAPKRMLTARLLDGIERVGNKMPSPSVY